MQTKIHAYRYNTANQAEREAWKTLRAELSATHPRCMESHGGELHYRPEWDNVTVELETAHIFENQWNTAPGHLSANGYRVFDWALDTEFSAGPGIKQGYYLEQTAEMREIRRAVSTCGYCGRHEPSGVYAFCPHCIGSEYLKASELRLTRMVPAGEPFGAKRAELTDAERAELLPIYRAAQLHGHTERDKQRIAKARADIIAKHARETRNATTERDGMLWLMDHGIRTDNVIFYNHTGRFGFGWRSPVDAETLSGLLDVISEFPHPYDIKTADGRKLSGD